MNVKEGSNMKNNMPAVLISVQPKWCELIANGKKTVEIRKTRPKLETPFKCYVYCTKDKWNHLVQMPDKSYRIYDGKYDKNLKFDGESNGKVIGEFVCDLIANYEAELWDDKTFERIQELYEPDDFTETGEYEYKTIADNGDGFWQENMLCKASCLTITEMRNYLGKGFSEFYGWHISDLVIYDEPKELEEFYHYCGDEPKCDGCSCFYHESNESVGIEEYCCSPIEGFKPMKRPPQSWCYVERVV